MMSVMGDKGGRTGEAGRKCKGRNSINKSKKIRNGRSEWRYR